MKLIFNKVWYQVWTTLIGFHAWFQSIPTPKNWLVKWSQTHSEKIVSILSTMFVASICSSLVDTFILKRNEKRKKLKQQLKRIQAECLAASGNNSLEIRVTLFKQEYSFVYFFIYIWKMVRNFSIHNKKGIIDLHWKGRPKFWSTQKLLVQESRAGNPVGMKTSTFFKIPESSESAESATAMAFYSGTPIIHILPYVDNDKCERAVSTRTISVNSNAGAFIKHSGLSETKFMTMHRKSNCICANVIPGVDGESKCVLTIDYENQSLRPADCSPETETIYDSKPLQSSLKVYIDNLQGML